MSDAVARRPRDLRLLARPHNELLILAGILLLAGILRFAELGREPLWLDEAFSWRWAHLPLSELWGAAARQETNPPLWFTVQRAAILLLGDHEAALRAPSALFGIAAVPLVWMIARTIAGPQAAALAALLLAVAPLEIAYAQEARGYTLLVVSALLVVLGTLVFVKTRLIRVDGNNSFHIEAVARRTSNLALAMYLIGGVIALYTHNTGAFIIMLANLGVLLCWVVGRPLDLRPLLPWVLANLLLAIVFLPWLPVLLEQAAFATNVAWIRQPSLARAVFETVRLYGPHFVLEDWKFGRAALALPLGVAMVVALRAPSRRFAVFLLALFAAGLPALVWLTGLLIRPLWIERVLLWSHAVGLVLAAIGIVSLGSRPARATLAGLIVLIALVDLVAWYGRPQKVSWSEAIAVAAREQGQNDLFLLVPHFYHWPFAYYARRAGLPQADVALITGAPPPPDAPVISTIDRSVRFAAPAELPALLEGADGAWLFTYKRRGQDPGGALSTLTQLGSLERRGIWTGSWDTGELELFRFTRAHTLPAHARERADPACVQRQSRAC